MTGPAAASPATDTNNNRRDCSARRGVLTNRVRHVAHLVQLQAHRTRLCVDAVDDDVASQLLARLLRAADVLEGGA
jgi:hypothetical protein